MYAWRTGIFGIKRLIIPYFLPKSSAAEPCVYGLSRSGNRVLYVTEGCNLGEANVQVFRSSDRSGRRGAGIGAGVSALPTAEVAVGDFYGTPMPLPDVAAGAIIRTEPAHLALSVPGQPEMIPASATRIMYRSNDTHDEPTAVVGSYLDPAAPWTGPGERPLVEFDVPALYALLARGMAVVMTGYQGLGTPAVDDFLNRKSQGYAVLDAARAASALPGNGIGAGAPVRLNGYSQGGSATVLPPNCGSGIRPRLCGARSVEP